MGELSSFHKAFCNKILYLSFYRGGKCSHIFWGMEEYYYRLHKTYWQDVLKVGQPCCNVMSSYIQLLLVMQYHLLLVLNQVFLTYFLINCLFYILFFSSEVERDFTAEIPAVRFIDNGTNLPCTLTVHHNHSYKIALLLSQYASINEHVRTLGMAFRLWAQVSSCLLLAQQVMAHAQKQYSILLSRIMNVDKFT